MRENAILAPVAILNDAIAGQKASFLLTAAVAVEDNLFWCQRQAVSLDGAVLHLLSTRIAGNEVLGCTQPAISMLGLGAPGSSLAIRGNSINVTDDGIRCGVDGAWICDNKVVNGATTAAARRNGAIGILLATGLDRNGSDQCQILSNQVSGFSGAGIQIAAPTRELIVKLNIIEDCGNGILLTGAATGGSVSIENNHLRNIGPTADGTASVIGIGLRRTETATIAGNIIRTLGVGAQQSALRAAILTFGVSRTRVLGNEMTDIAPPGDFLGVSAGIMIRAPFTQFDVSNNHVQRDAELSAQPTKSAWQALVVADANAKTPVVHAANLTIVRLSAGQLLVLDAGLPYLWTMVADAAGVPELARGSVQSNTLIARGPGPMTDVSASGECLFNQNRVDSQLNGGIAVRIATDVAIINANRVRGGQASIFVEDARNAAVLGNITSGLIVLPNGLPDPWDKLNLRA